MILYIAGPMTGIQDQNFPAFRDAAARLRAAGYGVLDPSRHDPNIPGYTHADYLRLGIYDILNADGIVLLPGWDKSRGATLEQQVAEGIGIPADTVDGWLENAKAVG